MLGFSGHVFGPDPHDLPLGILAGIPYENAMFEQWRFGMGPVAYEILILKKLFHGDWNMVFFMTFQKQLGIINHPN